jgi:pyruvate dehydrogenase E2 component (dihydrolipoamide acetyltransferase)
MATEIVMPQMGAEMDEGTVLKWLKQPGDQVNRGDIIAEIETDKATVELESFEAGTFLKAVVEEGTKVPVGEVIAYLGAPGEQPPSAPSARPGAPAAAGDGNEPGVSTHQRQAMAAVPGANARIDGQAAETGDTMRVERTASIAETTEPSRLEQPAAPSAAAAREGVAGQERHGARDSLRRDGVRLRVSPVARSMAEELGVDLTRIKGSGPEGRITRRDVEDYARTRAAVQVQGEEARAPAPVQPGPPPRPAPPSTQQVQATGRPPAPPQPAAPPAAPAAVEAEDEVEPLTRMRQAIARRMATAKREIPHYYVAVSVDMTDGMVMRRDLNAQLSAGEHISVSHLIVKACSLALEHHPHFNATFTETGITVHHHINIGLAVALDDGLIVPAILDCRGKSLGALARASIDVAERARNGRLRPAELNDGTFTVSNLGMYGVETLIAIIQPGQAAILGVGRVEDRPVVRDGQIVVRSMMTIALSADHRVTDGAQGAQFVAEIKDLLEHPTRLVL